MCSTASESAASSITARTGKKSRTSSAGGDSLGAGTAFDAKSKPRSTKYNVRILPSVLKNARRAPKPPRPPRHANIGNLQNAVVLAPFYTLKRCYQNKLVDLYANEKMKKVNQKIKMAKKQNMSFEYDIIELKPLPNLVKKETKPPKKQQQQQQQGRSRSASYCQCKKPPSGEGRQSREDGSKQVKRPKEGACARVSCFSGESMAKRRKLTPGTLDPTHLKCELTPGIGLGSYGGNFSPSGKCSGSKCESWESYSNSASCKEEHLQGSLAISNTSFDSYFEHFDKGGWGCSASGTESAKKPRDREQMGAEFLQKPVVKNLVGNAEGKSSDGEILDFMDREPQSHGITIMESNENWQMPLRRRRRVQRKKPESESVAGYYLRSLSPGRERDRQTNLPPNRQECRYACGNTSNKSKCVQVEMGGQAEGSASGVQEPRLSSSRRGQRESTPDERRADVPEEETPEQPVCSSRSPQGNAAASVEHIPQDDRKAPEVDAEEDQSECFGARTSGTALGILEDGSEPAPRLESLADLHERFPEPADSRQPGDKDSDYIFGARSNGGGGQGESCEFSFGLKWVFSDDDD